MVFLEARLLPSPSSPGRGNTDSCSLKIPEPGTAAPLSCNLHFPPVPVTSAATAVQQTRIQAQKACDLPSILQGSWSAVGGGMQAVRFQHPSSSGQFPLWMLPMCKSHEVGYSDLKMEDGSGNQPVVWWNKSQQYFL